MNFARKAVIAAAATAVSFGLLGISAPAHADTSWGYKVGAVHTIKR
jgi:hypothetical protein